MSRNNYPSLENLFRNQLLKATLLVAFSFGLILIIQTAMFSWQSQNAVCEIFKSKIEQYGSSLGREIALGDRKVASEIFHEFKLAIDRLKTTEDLEINFIDDVASSNKPCSQSVFQSKISQPIYFGEKPVALIKGTVRYLPGTFFLFGLVALSFILALVFKRWRKTALDTIQTKVVQPLMYLSEGHELGSIDLYTKDVQQISYNIKSLKNRLLREKRKTILLEKDKALADIATRVAHDIRSPVEYINMLANEDDNGLSEDKIKLLKLAADRIKGIASDLLNEFKSQKDRSADEKPILPSVIAENLIKEKKNFYSHKSVEFNLEVEQDAAAKFIKLSDLDLTRALSNLIENSVESNLNGPLKINISLALVANDFLKIRVADNGKGANPWIVEHLGKKGATFEKKNGTGLGLYFVKDLAKNYGGTVKIDSGAKGGFNVEMLFPVASAPIDF